MRAVIAPGFYAIRRKSDGIRKKRMASEKNLMPSENNPMTLEFLIACHQAAGEGKVAKVAKVAPWHDSPTHVRTL